MPDQTINTTDSRQRHFVAAFLAACIWGFMIIPLRLLKSWPALDILTYRILVAALTSWGFILLFRRAKLKSDVSAFKQLPYREKRRTVLLTILASSLLVGNWYSYIFAVNSISVQSAAFAYMICPLITTFAAFFILKEKLSNTQWLALLFALGSVLLLAKGSLTDVLFSVLIASLYAFYLITQRVAQGFDKLNLLAVQLFICALLILPSILAGRHALPTDPTFWIVISAVAIVFTVVPLFLSMYALMRISSGTMGIMLYANPIITFLLAVFLYNETVSSYQYIAYTILLLAILLFNSRVLLKSGRNQSSAINLKRKA